jgi:predicted deacetylase
MYVYTLTQLAKLSLVVLLDIAYEHNRNELLQVHLQNVN